MENEVERTVEAESVTVETGSPEIFQRLILELEKSGFEDIHKKALKSACRNIKSILNIDPVTKASYKKRVNTPRPHIFLDLKTNSVIMLSEPERTECVRGKRAFEVTCFSRTQNEVITLVDNLRKILAQAGLRKETIRNGDFDENCDKNFIRSLTETGRSTLIKQVNEDVVSVFTIFPPKKGLRRLTTLPIKFFSSDMFRFGEEEIFEFSPQTLVSLGLLEEKFSLKCKMCETSSLTMTPIFNSKKDASSSLQNEFLLCSNCGKRLTSESASIISYFRFTDLGLECAKGLWLDGYVKSLLEALGVKRDMMKSCAIHGKDELDLVFDYYGDLYICECKDRVVGRNDVYVLAMKASRINEDEEAEAKADKVLMVSTEPISKDIVPTPQKGAKTKKDKEPEYVFITGNTEAIKQELIKVIRKSKRRHKREKMKLLSECVLDCLPPTEQEITKRFLATEEFW